MLKYLAKFTVDIFPSVAATVIGAYIVNHYIVSKPEAPAAAAVSTVSPKIESKPAEASNHPEAGVKAKGMSERTLIERAASEKAPVVEKSAESKPAEAKPVEAKAAEAKPADTQAETASIPAEPRRHQPGPREKAVAKVAPVPQQPATTVAVAPSSSPVPAEPVAALEEHRDANDLARAAIERLRNEGGARLPEPARPAESPRVVATPVVAAPPALRPLPPPIMVSTPSEDQAGQPRPPYAATVADDPNRPTPPADIPRPPLDLRAEAAPDMPKDRQSIGDDMLSAAKSVFHAVLPK